MNEPGTQPQQAPGVEQPDEPEKQAPGYNETDREANDTDGDTNQIEPEWRPGDKPSSTPPNTGMQGEGEPGRAHRDSTGGVEGGGNGT